MLNTIPQDPSSVMRFVDGADERQLMSMVSSKNPYSFMALAKLQSIRDAKMKEQAGQPTPPPMSEQIPQQLAQLASGQQPQQQPPMQQQPQQQPMQQPQPQQPPMQPQGIASIGGEPNGAGGGMVSFTDGGGVRRFAESNDGGNVRHFQTGSPGVVTDDTESSAGILGKNSLEFIRSIPSPIKAAADAISSLTGTPEQKERSLQIQEKRLGLQNAIRELSPGTFEQLTSQERAQRNKALDYYTNELNNINKPTATTAVKSSNLSPEQTDSGQYGSLATTNAGAVERKAPAVADSGKTTSGAGSLNPAPMYKKLGEDLALPYAEQRAAQAAGITALTNAQTAMSPYYDPKKLAEFNPTDEERETLRQTKQTNLEKAFPNPYTKTANTLELLQKNLENAEGNTFNKALFKASLTLMGSKSPRFFQAASEAGLVGVEDYGRMQEANQKQRMALMNADTALATAQDSRKRGLYDQSAKQVSESLQFKKDAFLAEKDAQLAKGNMAIALEGEKAKIPALKIQHAQDLHTLQHNLLKDKIKIAELNLKGQQIAATAMPEMAKMLNWAGNHPGRLGELHDAKRREFFVKAATIAESALSKLVAANPMATEAEKKASYEGTLSTVMASYDKDYPRPLNTPRLS